MDEDFKKEVIDRSIEDIKVELDEASRPFPAGSSVLAGGPGSGCW